jgi:hypothetical protein
VVQSDSTEKPLLEPVDKNGRGINVWRAVPYVFRMLSIRGEKPEREKYVVSVVSGRA